MLIGVEADGEFGPQTVAAVKAWQKARGVKADGMVGPDMLLELGLLDLIILEKWDEGDLVRSVQESAAELSSLLNYTPAARSPASVVALRP